MFESSPGGNLGFEPDFKLSQEMIDIMGHKVDSAPYKQFTKLCVQVFLAIRPHYNVGYTLIPYSFQFNSYLGFYFACFSYA